MKSLSNHYGLQDITNLNSNILKKIKKLEIITNGKYCSELEKKISQIVRSKYTVTCNNGTSALMMSILSLEIKNIIAIIPNINFVASTNILSLINAKFVLCDVNKETGMIDLNTFKEVISLCKKKKIKPNLFIPMHYAGNILDLSEISKICKKNSIKIIEDGCHSFGSSTRDKHKNKLNLGSCKYSDLTTFSFHPVKNITTFEGGAVTTNNYSLFKKLVSLRSHSLEKTFLSDPYNLKRPSLNFRMSEINAIVGLNQLIKLNSFRNKRNSIVKKYLKCFNKLSNKITCINFSDDAIFWHLFVIQIKKISNVGKMRLMKYLNEKKIGCQIHYKPLYKHKIYKKNILFSKKLNSDIFYKTSLSLPLHTRLKEKDLIYVSNKVKNFVNKYV
jgi:dTDP-4-amino-4,6-dideoxygalactose transaminase